MEATTKHWFNGFDQYASLSYDFLMKKQWKFWKHFFEKWSIWKIEHSMLGMCKICVEQKISVMDGTKQYKSL